jgi:hypothetical protein
VEQSSSSVTMMMASSELGRRKPELKPVPPWPAVSRTCMPPRLCGKRMAESAGVSALSTASSCCSNAQPLAPVLAKQPTEAANVAGSSVPAMKVRNGGVAGSVGQDASVPRCRSMRMPSSPMVLVQRAAGVMLTPPMPMSLVMTPTWMLATGSKSSVVPPFWRSPLARICTRRGISAIRASCSWRIEAESSTRKSRSISLIWVTATSLTTPDTVQGFKGRRGRSRQPPSSTVAIESRAVRLRERKYMVPPRTRGDDNTLSGFERSTPEGAEVTRGSWMLRTESTAIPVPTRGGAIPRAFG